MLIRSIRKWDVVSLMINNIIGAGIFGLPSKIFALSGAYSIFALLACAVVIFIIILCFAEVSSRFNKTGGPYLYTLTAFGHFPAFLMGWLMITGRIVAFAALCNLLVTYLSFFTPVVNNVIIRIVTIFFIVALFTAINYIGVKNSTTVNNVLTIAKLLPLLLFVIVGLFHLQPQLFKFSETPDFLSFSSSVLVFVFAFGGFESVVVNAGEMNNPGRALPFAMFLSTIIVVLLYGLIQVVSIGTLPALATSEKPLADAAGQVMGNVGGSFIGLGAIISIAGTINALVLIASRLPFAMSNEGQFSKFFSHVHPRFHTPTTSLLFVSVIAFVFAIIGSFAFAAALSSIIRVITYFIICTALIKLRKKIPGATNYFKIPSGYFFGITGMLLSLWLLSSSKWSDLRIIVIVMLAGAVIYILRKLFRR